MLAEFFELWYFKSYRLFKNRSVAENEGNLKELKTYNNGLPYISGQSMRHALRESMKRENEGKFKETSIVL